MPLTAARSDAEVRGTLHDMFVAQAEATPERMALVDGLGSLTYGELATRAEYLASHLAALGVARDTAVGLYLRKSSAYMVALMAALMAGGAFFVIEVASPRPLLKHMLATVAPPVVITDAELEPTLIEALDGAECSPVVIEYEAHGPSVDKWMAPLSELVAAQGLPPLPADKRVPVDRDALAFVSASSGTTGMPKAILNPHHAPVTSYIWRWSLAGGDYTPLPGRNGYVVAANVFYIWESIRPLLRGGTLLSIPNSIIYDFPALVSYLEEHDVSEMLFTPSLIESLLASYDMDALRALFAGFAIVWLNGEVVTRKLLATLESVLPDSCALYNLYSISECHEVAALNLRKPELLADSPAVAPVGFPADTAHCHILDSETLAPVAPGEAGELFVSGPVLARGYSSPG